MRELIKTIDKQRLNEKMLAKLKEEFANLENRSIY